MKPFIFKVNYKNIHCTFTRKSMQMAGLREKQKLAREQRILKAATTLFNRDGYDKTRIEDIAEIAEISAGTAYNYYKSKADLLIAVVSMEVEESFEAGKKVVESPPSSAADALNTLTALYYEHSLVYLSKDMWRMAMSFSLQRPQTPFGRRYSELDRQICLQFASLLLVLQQNGQIVSSIDPVAMAQIIFNNLNMMFVEFVKSDTMTIQELRATVEQQVRPLAHMISNH